MEEFNNILDNPDLKKLSFSVPEGYFAKMEDQVREIIATPEHVPSGIMRYFKPALGLLCSFGLVFGLGYGIFALTGTLLQEDDTPYVSLIENGYINRSTIDHFSLSLDDIEQESDIDDDLLSEEIDVEDDVVGYLASELSATDIPDIYSDLNK